MTVAAGALPGGGGGGGGGLGAGVAGPAALRVISEQRKLSVAKTSRTANETIMSARGCNAPCALLIVRRLRGRLPLRVCVAPLRCLRRRRHSWHSLQPLHTACAGPLAVSGGKEQPCL